MDTPAATEAPGEAAVELSGMLLELIGTICRDQRIGQPGDYQARKIIAAAGHIQEKNGIGVDINQLAKKSGLSSSHFRKLFRERFGRSPSVACQQAKIRKACELLAYGDLNVSEIAELLEYGSIHNFSRAFRQFTSRSPTEYRRGAGSRLTAVGE